MDRMLSKDRKPLRQQKVDRQRGRCYYCGQIMDSYKNMNSPKRATLDHLIPLAKGGNNHPSNMVAACFDCNSKKADRHPLDRIEPNASFSTAAKSSSAR